MIVPDHWAESRIQQRVGERQITVRRFGWSETSQEDAQANADARVREAFDRIAAGEKLPRRELKVPYNGAEGLPIREQVLARHGATVITRNIYGAHCLNTPDVLFADIDFPERSSTPITCLTYLVLLAAAIAWGIVQRSPWIGVLASLGVLFFGHLVGRAIFQWRERSQPNPEEAAITRVREFLQARPDWHARMYRTPRGLRLLALHQTFDPTDAAVREHLQNLGTDPVYIQMCQNQRCFRARVSPKPWRMGINQHMRPRPGVWPIAPERMAVRQQWIENYEAKAPGYASCRYLESFGPPTVDPVARQVWELHDHLCRAESTLPLA
jgi:hypothetical protein